MKRVFAIQLSNWHPLASLPHAIATIWNYTINDKSIKYKIGLVDVFWQDESVEEVVNDISDPDILMCSCYIWNWEATYEIIKQVKKKYPNCLVIIGGPEPKYSCEWMQEHPEVDVLVAYYGEVTFKNIIESYTQGNLNFDNIAGVVTKKVNNKDDFIYPVLDDIPSPYLNGFYDWILSRKKDRITSIRSVYETNRGCPYSCAFCDLGAEQYRKVKKFDTERCLLELEWMVKNNVDIIDVADSNFGAFKRDEEFVDRLIELKRLHNFKGSFMPTWSKTKGKHILNLGKKIIKSGLDTMFNISIQSPNYETLKVVNRTNAFRFEELSGVIEYIHKDDIIVYTDLIFPMPGDTLTSIKKGIDDIIDLEHTFDKIQMNHLTKLTNTPMNSDMYSKYHLEWTNIKGNSRHYFGDLVNDRILSATKQMSRNDVFEAIFYLKCIYQPFYYYGLFRNLILNFQHLGFSKRSEVINVLLSHLSRLDWFIKYKESFRDHYFSALDNYTHFGHKLDPNYNQYYPEYALSYITYMENNIHDEVKNLFDKKYYEVIDFDKLSHWNNTPKDQTLECINWNSGVWNFYESRQYTFTDYAKRVFIKGRFSNDWKIESIKKCQ